MAKPNSSIPVSVGTGATIATDTVDSKEFQALIMSNKLGHLVNSFDGYFVYSADNSTLNAANRSIQLLFNVNGSYKLIVKGVWIIPNNATITTATRVSYDINLISTVGSGGTSTPIRGADSNGFNLESVNGTNVKALRGATSLPTVSYTLFSTYTWMDEISASNGLLAYENQLPVLLGAPTEVVLNSGEGIEVREGSDAQTEGITNVLIYFTIV
jgi:hypothetical protein